MLYEAKLTYEELVLLDGRCSENTQKIIDVAKQHELTRITLENEPTEVKDFCALLVTYALETGALRYTRRSLGTCKACGKRAGYAKYARTSRYHRKGDINYKKPLSFYGYDFKDSFIIITGYSSLGICPECWAKIQPKLSLVLKGIKAEISEKITGEKPQYRKVAIRHCKKCGWTGLESEMGKSRTLMGDGYYPSTCPNCKAENRPMGNTYVESTGKWEVVNVNTDSSL